MKRAASPRIGLARLGGLALAVALLAVGWTASAKEQKPAKHSASAIQIKMVTSDEVKLPPAFQMALYENVIQEVRKTGKFQHVYRDGERAAADAPDLVTMHSTVRGFKEGSARMRQVTTVAGATSIKVLVQITTRDGQMLLARDVEGKVHFLGENMRATYNFAKNVAKVVRKSF